MLFYLPLLCSYLTILLAASLEDLEIEEFEVLNTRLERRQVATPRKGPIVSHCDYILPCKLASLNCTNGSKFVIKKVKGVRKQFLILNGEAVIAFVENKKKFASCSSFEDITASVKCKGVDGLDTIDLESGGQGEENSGGGSGSSGYTQAWLRGPGNEGGHAHEGIELADGKGFVAAGSKGENRFLVMRVTAEASTKVWSASLGGAGKSTGITVIEVESRSMVVAGGGLHQTSTGKQSPVLVAFDTETGNELWQTKLAGSGHGCVRGVILDGDTLVATGYIGNQLGGFVFIAEDGSKAMAWRLDLDGNVLDTKTLTPTEGDYDLTQGAKIRADPINGGFVVVTTVWNTGDQQDVVVIKLDSSLNVEWNKAYGLSSGQDQVFDLLVDGDGNYVLGGHTTTGTGVVNWDYLAIKVDGKTKEEIWRRTYGQPRGFDPRYIHDEMYGVGLDQDGNYILLGGSGDEYPYSANSNGWSSDVWVSFLVTVSKDGTTLSEQVFGTKSANNAGEWVTVMRNGDLMVYTDSDTVPGFGFLKLTKN